MLWISGPAFSRRLGEKESLKAVTGLRLSTSNALGVGGGGLNSIGNNESTGGHRSTGQPVDRSGRWSDLAVPCP